MRAMLLCAGLGTRFRPQTKHIPKPAIPFLGVPLAGFGLYYLEKMNLSHLVVNTHHLSSGVQAAMEAMTSGQAYTVNYLDEQPVVLGSGGGIQNAKSYLLDGSDDDCFIVINGDEVILAEDENFLGDMLAAHRKSGALMTMLLTDHPEAGKSLGGVAVDKDMRVMGLSVKKAPPGSSGLKHNCGVYIYSRKVFDLMPLHKKGFHIFNDCLIPALNRGEKIFGYHRSDIMWLDVSSEADYIRSTREAILTLLKDIGPAACLRNILSRFKQDFEVISLDTGILLKGKGSQIGDAVEVNGFAVLSAGSRFDQGVLQDSVIGKDLHIHEMVLLKSQLVLV